MHAKILILFIFACFSAATIHSNNITKNDIIDLLTQIDGIIDEGDKYQHIRINKADSLYRVARRSKGYARIDAYKQIIDIYSHFQSDSALRAINLVEQTDEATMRAEGDISDKAKKAKMLPISVLFKARKL